jgi:holin-like protein
MRGLAILLAFNLVATLALPLPGSVIGLILFTLALAAGWVRLEWVEAPAGFLLRHMMLLFAPLVVGVVQYRDQLRTEWAAMVGAVVGATLMVLLVSGAVAQALLPKSDRQETPPDA